MNSTNEKAISIEQRNALENAQQLYLSALPKLDTNARKEGLDMLIEAFNILSEFVDDVDDIYYRVVFANVVQDMQDTGEFDMSEDCEHTKIDIYLQTLKWFQSAESYQVGYRAFLWSVFNKLGGIFLKGEEFLDQNDGLARLCFLNNKILEHPLADIFLDYFIQNEDGEWIFTGKRPD